MPICHYNKEPEVSVGIVSGVRINFSFKGNYAIHDNVVSGEQQAEIVNGFIRWNGKAYTELMFVPTSDEASFSLKDVVIGVNFHWERKETQTFLGKLRLLADRSKIWAINELPVENYLESVISSEMSATSNMPLLMAHAVISRSWLLAQMQVSCKRNDKETREIRQSSRLIKWYDHTDHTLFNVCADDHCQRYQGITMETNDNVKIAIQQTRGELLTYGDEICDARFSKCCGGAMEEFQYCWENSPKPYLKGKGDNPDGHIPDLTIEANADKWIRSVPESFCNTHDRNILGQVLNDYDQETEDFYRWHVDYTQEELSRLVNEKTGIDFGNVIELVPLKRGTSGRLYEMEIVGTKRRMVIGKELEIRRVLSPTHLYSSAFVVDRTASPSLKTGGKDSSSSVTFHIVGAGWGHGVGLCQIGAAVMGAKGFSYDRILEHYYPGTTLSRAW